MELYVFNSNLELQHVIDGFTSLIWTRKYHKPGDFELHIPLNADNIKHLIRGNIIWKKGGIEAGYIETIEINLDVNGNEDLVVKGKFLSNYMSYRIVWGRISYLSTSAETIMRMLVNECCIAPWAERKIDNIALADYQGFPINIYYQNNYGSVIEELENVSNTSGLGYRMVPDFENKLIVFSVYQGVDRSINQTSVAPCIFSREFENILSQAYMESDNNYKNVAIIAGEGEGDNRVVTWVNHETVFGLERRELFVDARDLQKEVDGVVMSDADYIKTLQQRGREKLAEYNEIQAFESAVNTQGNNVYKTDYDLGDIVTIQDTKWGLRLDTRITEIQEVYEGGKVEINPTFGSNIPTIIDKIKRMVK